MSNALTSMRAVILAGGKGTRLRPYTTTIPKPLVPVGERPILSIILAQLRRAGFSNVTMAVNHMADLIMAFFGDGSGMGLDITYSTEEKPLGTVGPVRLIQNLPEHFLVMNGDVLSDLDYRALFQSHIASGALLTVGTYSRQVRIDFGVLTAGPSGKLTDFAEKPTYDFQVSMGVYAFRRSILEYVPEHQPFGFDDLVLTLLRENRPVNLYTHRGYWLDLGRPDDFDKANEDFYRIDNLRLGATA